MKILKIKKLKNDKYKIEFDNSESIITYDDVIINNSLLFNKQVDSDLLNKLNIETGYYDVYNKAVKFISKRLRSEKEISVFLTKESLSDIDKDKIINKLKNINLINDSVFAQAYFQDRFNLSTDGPFKIRRYLEDNNIDEVIIETIFNKLDTSIVEQKLEKLILKRIKTNNNKSKYMLKQKIIGDMINLGYEKSMIINIIDNTITSNSIVVKKEYDKLYHRLSNKYVNEELDRIIKLKLLQKGFSEEEISTMKKSD